MQILSSVVGMVISVFILIGLEPLIPNLNTVVATIF